MQRRLVCAVIRVSVALLSVVPVFAQGAQPPQVAVETVYPRHAARGQTTVINIAVPRGQVVKGAEISPSTGVKVAGIKGTAGETEQAIGWWEITLDVAKDAPPGDRSLVLVMAKGRAAPATISVPTHVPTISDLRIVPPQTNQATFDVQLAAADTANDLGPAPYVWFTADCGGEPIVGAVRGVVNAGVIRAVVPHLRKAAGSSPAAGKCDLQVRITDSTGIDSNTLKSAVEFTN
jgi:hypothetical protein